MKNIYAVQQTYQAYDGDGWQHWEENRILSYHSTIEGANIEKQRLVNKWIEDLNKEIELNPNMDILYWNKEKERRINNIILITEGAYSSERTEDDDDECEHYTVVLIQLKD